MSRGISAVQIDSQPLQNPTEGMAKYPCYIGQAPIWQINDEKWMDLAGKTMIIRNLKEMKEKTGYFRPESGVWGKEFSLCAAADYHFKVKMVGPIIVAINKAAIQTGETETKQITFSEGMAKIENPYIVLSTIAISGKEKETDYTVEYDECGRNIIINAITAMETAEITYKSADCSALSFQEDTFEELDFFEQSVGAVPDVLSAPLWEREKIASKSITVGEKLMEIAHNPLNGHWYVQAIIQLSGEIKSDAVSDKKKYNSSRVKACWPCIKKDGMTYPLTLAYTAAKESVDSENAGVPYESASNELIGVDGTCTETGGTVRMKEGEANELNEIGIATANFSSMQWVTWGVCMSNYSEKKKEEIPPDKLNDTAVQMKDYISNSFQERYARQIDKPMGVRQTKDIVTDFQMFLDSLVNSGRLVHGEIEFLENKNSYANLADGTFTFSIAETSTPPGKAITGEVAYSSDALQKYFEEGAR